MKTFELFIKERRYLKNVSPRTVQWYEESFAWLKKYELTEQGLKDFVMGMRDGGLKPISCNSRIRVANAYFKWAELPLHITPLKEEELVLPTFTSAQVSNLVGFRPKGRYQRRLHILVCFLLDVGCRIEEALSVKADEIDFDNLLLRIHGKGNKERVIPFSTGLRKLVWRYLQDQKFELLFCTRDGHKLDRHVVLRDFKILCRKRLGFEPPPRAIHAIRHTFATNYIRRGGSQFMLMKVLGHTSLEMTKKYVNFQTDDLSAVHNRLSLLSR